MAKYSEWVSYFEQLATENNLIKHTVTNKKFFKMNIEELFSAIPVNLPAPSDGPFFVFINYISDKEESATPFDKKQMMFLVLQGHKKNDYDGDLSARDNSEEATLQILQRMRKDSLEGLPLFSHGFDKIKARSVPTEIRANINYTGWQTTFNPINTFNECFDASNWTIAP